MVVTATLVAAATAAAGAGSTWVAHQLSRTARARRRVRRALASATQPLRAAERERAEAEAELVRAGASWAPLAPELALARTAIEALREEGAERVPFGALRAAGIESALDLLRRRRAEVLAIEGIGPTSLERLVSAASALRARLAERPPPAPPAELEDPRELALGRAALGALIARETLDAPLASAREELAAIEPEVAQALAAAGAWRWALGGAGRRARALAALERAEQRARQFAGGDPTALLLAARERLAERRRALEDDGRVRSLYAERLADVAALVERALAARGQALPPPLERTRGDLPEAVARRIEAFELAAGDVDVTLRGYQEFGAKYLLVQRRAVLGDEMGLGKTIQALAAMAHLAREREGARFLVVAPASVLYNWSAECSARTRFAVHVLHGEGLEEACAAWLTGGGVGLCSYATLARRELDRRIVASGVRLDLFVADEAHFVKNPRARRSQAVACVARHAERAAFLSGTPMENRPAELVRLFAALGLAGTSSADLEELEALAEGGRARRFRALSSEVYLRRNQRDVLRELPERIEIVEHVEPFEAEWAAYREALAAQSFTGLRRAMCLGDGERPSAKEERLAELLEEHRAAGRKVVVFTFFLDVVERLARRFAPAGTITGAVPPAQRLERIEALGRSDGYDLLVCQIDAAGAGLNMQCAGVVVLFEPQLKPTSEAQAIARVHRMGQPEVVLVHRLVARHSVDERLVELLGEKGELFDAFARKSALKEASPAAIETSLARRVLEFETARLAARSGAGGAPGAAGGPSPGARRAAPRSNAP